jgi:hypothetical protein
MRLSCRQYSRAADGEAKGGGMAALPTCEAANRLQLANRDQLDVRLKRVRHFLGKERGRLVRVGRRRVRGGANRNDSV